jgi:hypothetical protein
MFSTFIATLVTPMAEPRMSPFSIEDAVDWMFVSRLWTWFVVPLPVPVVPGCVSVVVPVN